MIEGAKSLHLSSSNHVKQCCYGDCIIAQNETLEEVIKVKRKQNQLNARASRELEKRLKVSISTPIISCSIYKCTLGELWRNEGDCRGGTNSCQQKTS